MPNVSLSTTPRIWIKGYATNLLTANANDNDVATLSTSNPAANHLGVHYVGNANLAKIMFFGAGAENSQMNANIYGYSPTQGSANSLWIPTLIGRFTCTLSAVIGVTGESITNTDRMCDAIALIEGDPTCKIVTDVNDRIASVLVDLEGAQYIAVKFNWTAVTTASTSANFVYSTL